jgi:hypothetical protein
VSYECKILADSVDTTAYKTRLTTMQITFPRIVLAEFNTHRMFSRNSASSRAIPVEKNIGRVLFDPFIPTAFAMNKRGMQAGVELDERDNSKAQDAWLRARDAAVAQANALADLGVHKQWANRLLEPFGWHTVIVTATEWENFFALRCHAAAAPEIRTIAEMMRDALAASTPREVVVGAWHLPLVLPIDYDEVTQVRVAWEPLVKLSIARCARVSYLTHDGKRDVDADLVLYERLKTSGHLSPFEHAAFVVGDTLRETYPWASESEFCGNFRLPWISHRKTISGEAVWTPSV